MFAMPSPTPELTTARLRLRAPTLEDAEALFGIYGDPEAMRYVGREPMTSPEEMREKLTRDLEAEQRGEAVRWACTLRGEQRAIGFLALFHWSQRDRRAELGYVLARSHWGQSVMKEVLPVVVRYGFEVMKLHRIEARIDPENTASLKLAEGLGFQREGLLRDENFSGGRFRSTLCLGLLEHEVR
jgi:ribosomal-protein-alanine N-acetyltransferase